MKKDIRTFVAECDTCQWHKAETVKPLGKLQPLTIPAIVWIDISMDFIVGWLKVGNKSIIVVVVECLFKYARFRALQHSSKASIVAQVFMDNAFKLHGMPTSIVTDHDPTFTSNFWKEFFFLQGNQLHLSMAY